MSTSADAYNNSAYEFLCLAHTGTRSQGNLSDYESDNPRRERLAHGRSIDQYVEMNAVFNINIDEEDQDEKPTLQRGKSEDIDLRRSRTVAITSM